MKYSIILPIYNVEKYLRQCIDGFLVQTLDDYEIILVNDGSKDSSGLICDEYAKKHEKVRVIHQENQGLSGARNTGLKHAKGEYIIFIDSDDFIDNENFLAIIEEKTKTNPDLILYRFTKYFDGSGKLEPFNYTYDSISGSPEDIYLELVKRDGFFAMAWNKVIKRSLLVDNNIAFEPGLLGEDADWFFSFLFKVKKLELIDQEFVFYRQRESSITSSPGIKNLTDSIYIIRKWTSQEKLSLLTAEQQKIQLHALAKHYANLLILYSRVKDKEKLKHKKRVKEMRYLLDYGLTKRPRLFRKYYRFFGFNILMMLIKIADPARKRKPKK